MIDRNLSVVPLRSLSNCIFDPVVVYARAIQEFVKERFSAEVAFMRSLRRATLYKPAQYVWRRGYHYQNAVY